MSNQPLVAIIDDDNSLRTALAGLARSMGYRVQLAASADKYLTMIAQERPDCIITDIHMPGMDGIALKHWLDQHGYAIPLIMMTARTEEILLARARNAQPFCLLRKPFDADQMVASIDRAVAEAAP